jgi:ubiquinone/menaquinone biosynthesis C-methylase UbiE
MARLSRTSRETRGASSDADDVRVQIAYARRDVQSDPLGSQRTKAELHRSLALRSLLSRNLAVAPVPASVLRVLEVGCGTGGVLEHLLTLGVTRSHLTGVDLVERRLRQARENTGLHGLVCASGASLPFPNDSFDLVLQFTMLTSVLSSTSRRAIASEMSRVLRPGGSILSYDFVWNPRNPDTRGLSKRELAALFPGWSIRTSKVTLVPPLANTLIHRSVRLVRFLESLRALNSHYWAVVTREPGSN